MYRPAIKEEGALLAQTAQHWGLALEHWENWGNRVYRLACQQGCFVLKSMSFPLAEFQYIQQAQGHLWDQGFRQVAPPLQAKDGSYLLPWQDGAYSLSPCLAGNPADFRNQREAALVGTSLAQLHLASQGYHCHCYPQRLKWGNTIQMCCQKRREMIDFAQQAACYQPLSLPELLYPQGLALALRQADFALELLKSYYPTVDEQARQQSGFCHHDLTSGNLLVTAEGKVNFIDFDYCISDFRGHDLANLLTKIMKQNQWQTQQAKQAFAAYQQVFPLTLAERMVTLALLHFPQVFWQAGLARYVEGWVPEEKISRRLRLWRDEAGLRQRALAELADSWKGGV